ncbi:MAG: M50 family metallopeptidase [Rickettsiales bacterium]|jgi:regulator of sigma E protease|nr:M50 family metallopeptidase [Rickettsiales bacterium]
MLSIIGLIIVLGLVIFVHELGHFAACRWAKVKVKAFSIGFGLGRPILQWKDKNKTEWRLGWIPLGGYVDPDEKGLKAAPRYKQAVIMAAGIVLNFVLAWLLFVFLFAARPEPIVRPTIGVVVENSLAQRAGVEPGWTIKKINGERIPEWSDLLRVKTLAGGDEVAIEFDNGKTINLIADKSWGLTPAAPKNPQYKKRTAKSVLSRATTEVWTQSKLLFVVLKQIVSGERDSKQLGSFLTIAKMSGDALAAGFFALLAMIAVLSINLGVINLLPIPALDGGHLLFILCEAITRRKLGDKTKNYIILCGWAALIAFMAFAINNDLNRVFGI